jgi:hypothetical protein
MKFLKKNKKKTEKDTKGTSCLNCGQELSTEDNFCPKCGQINYTGRISLKHYFSDLLAGFFSFDNRFLKTIYPLIFKPGKVTREYIEGKRTRYVNPFQLYLHITIIFFLMIGLFDTMDKYSEIPSEDLVEYEKERAEVFDSIKKDLDDLLQEKEPQTEKTVVTDSIKKESDRISTKDSLPVKENEINIDVDYDTGSNDTLTGNKKDLGVKFISFINYEKDHKDTSVREALKDLGYSENRWNVFYYSKAKDFNKFSSGDSDFISSYGNNFTSKTSLALFFLLPLFTLIVALLYLKSDYNYSEHLVFVFHVQTVFFIMLLIVSIFDRIFDTGNGIIIFFILFLFYLYKALRNFFRQGRFITIVKFIILNLIYSIMAIFGLIIVAFIAFLI